MRLRALFPFLLAAMILASSKAFAVTLQRGDLVVAFLGLGLIHFDSKTGQHTVISPGSYTTIAIDTTGTLWSHDTSNLLAIDPESGQVTSSYRTGSFASKLAFISQQHLLLANGGQILKVDTPTGTGTVLSQGGLLAGGAFGLTITESGRVFVAVYKGGGVVEINPTTGAQTLISGGFSALGIAADPQGQLYVSGEGSEGWSLYRVDASTGSRTAVSPNIQAFAVAIEESGQVVVGDMLGRLIRIDPVTGQQTLLGVNSGLPFEIAVVGGDLPDRDEDGVFDRFDNCPDIPNPTQADTDGNRVGDACNDAEDWDGDEWADNLDNCPDASNPDQRDLDGDLIGDVCDPFPTNPDNEFAQCTVDRDECQENLLACSNDLVQSLGELAQAQQENASLRTALAASEARIVQLEAELTACQGDLNQCLNPPPQCSDGIDNDGDGKIDFPADRQCRSPDDLSELALPVPPR